MNRYTKQEILDELVELEELVNCQSIRLGMGPQNADRALKRIEHIRNLVRTNGNG